MRAIKLTQCTIQVGDRKQCLCFSQDGILTGEREREREKNVESFFQGRNVSREGGCRKERVKKGRFFLSSFYFYFPRRGEQIFAQIRSSIHMGRINVGQSFSILLLLLRAFSFPPRVILGNSVNRN